MRVAAALSRTAEAELAAAEAADATRQGLGGAPCDLALVFCSAGHAAGLPGVGAAVAACLGPTVVAGAVAEGVVGPGEEVEDGPAVAVWAAAFEQPGAVIEPFRTFATRVPDRGVAVVGWPDTHDGATTILLADPRSYPIGEVIEHLATERPGHPIIGGLLTTGHHLTQGQPGAGLLLGAPGETPGVHGDGAVGVALQGVPVRTIVSQGCRPIGEPLTVTSVDGNVLLELAGQPAAERLRELFATASPADRERIRHGLHVGVVTDPYRDRFDAGDFVIRAVLGADVDGGGVAIGDRVEVGQVVQFQVRDAQSAHADLEVALSAAAGASDGALLFTCNGRGRHLFDEDAHDARLVGEQLTDRIAGAFCAGEIGPVGQRNYVHGFTASLAVFGGGTGGDQPDRT